jgi:hypothetical protein
MSVNLFVPEERKKYTPTGLHPFHRIPNRSKLAQLHFGKQGSLLERRQVGSMCPAAAMSPHPLQHLIQATYLFRG